MQQQFPPQQPGVPEDQSPQSTPQKPLPRAAADPAQISMSVRLPGYDRPGLFRSLWVRPNEAIYENLEADEVVLALIGRHWVSRVWRFFFGFLLAVLPLGAVPFLLSAFPEALAYILILTWFWYSFVFLYFIALFVLWKSDVYLLTNERIIDFNTSLYFMKQSRDTEIGYIHEVDHSRPTGLIRGGLDYGTVRAKFSGDEFEVEMKHVMHPEQLALAIGELAEAARRYEVDPYGATFAPR